MTPRATTRLRRQPGNPANPIRLCECLDRRRVGGRPSVRCEPGPAGGAHRLCAMSWRAPNRHRLPAILAAALLSHLGGVPGPRLLALAPWRRRRFRRALLAHVWSLGFAASPDAEAAETALAAGGALTRAGLDSAAAALYLCEHDGLLMRQDGDNVLVRGMLRLKAGEALLRSGGVEAARRCVLVLESTAAELGRLTRMPCSCRETAPAGTAERLRFHSLELAGYAHLYTGRPRRAAAAFRLAAATAETAGEPELAAAAWVLVAEALSEAGDDVAARRLLRSRWPRLAEARDPEVRARWSPLLTVEPEARSTARSQATARS